MSLAPVPVFQSPYEIPIVKLKRSIYAILTIVGCLSTALEAATVSSQGHGKWGDGKTWASGKVPQKGDQVIILHRVDLHRSQTIGHAPAAQEAEPAILIKDGGALELKKNTKLTSKGPMVVHGTLTISEGAHLELKAEGSHDISYPIALSPTQKGKGKLILKGKKKRMAKISSEPINRAFITDGHRLAKQENGSYYRFPEKGGTIDAQYAHFYGLGNSVESAWQYTQKDGMIVRIVHSLFEKCGRIEPRGLAKIKMNIEHTKWKDSLALSKKQINQAKALFKASAKEGSDCLIRYCDFDELVSLSLCNGYIIEDSIFRSSIIRYQGKWHEGKLKSFKRNLVRWPEKYSKGGIRLAYGESFEDCIFLQDYQNHNNPHFMFVGGQSGVAKVRGCLFWFTGPNDVSFGPEGDGPMPGDAISGSSKDNQFIIERCIMMPNSLGPDQPRNLSTNITSGVFSTKNSTVIVRRNTAYSSGPGGVCIGETHPTVKGALSYVKSNLFIGSKENDGKKAHDFHLGEKGGIRARDFDYNAGYRLIKGSNYIKGKTGKGYNELKLVGDLEIGKNDIDDIDPKFVDPNRNLFTWSTSLKGDGTVIDAMNQIQPTGKHTMMDLISYLREGFRPQNPKLKGAGDPDAGSPDIGAVDLK
jgi:hypothetical protein